MKKNYSFGLNGKPAAANAAVVKVTTNTNGSFSMNVTGNPVDETFTGPTDTLTEWLKGRQNMAKPADANAEVKYGWNDGHFFITAPDSCLTKESIDGIQASYTAFVKSFKPATKGQSNSGSQNNGGNQNGNNGQNNGGNQNGGNQNGNNGQNNGGNQKPKLFWDYTPEELFDVNCKQNPYLAELLGNK